MTRFIVLAVVLLGLTACSSGVDPRDVRTPTRRDAGVQSDGGEADGGDSPDAGDGGDDADAGPGDAGCEPSCSGKQCGDDGCGGTCGPGCSAEAECGEDSRCHCGAGAHDGGDGRCVPTGTCSAGFILGTDGQCKACSSTSQCKLGEYCTAGRCQRSAVDCADCSACGVSDCQKLAWIPQNDDWLLNCKVSATRPACPAGSTRVCAIDLNSTCFFVGEESCWCELKRCVRSCTSNGDCPSGYTCQTQDGVNRCLPPDWGMCQ